MKISSFLLTLLLLFVGLVAGAQPIQRNYYTTNANPVSQSTPAPPPVYQNTFVTNQFYYSTNFYINDTTVSNYFYTNIFQSVDVSNYFNTNQIFYVTNLNQTTIYNTNITNFLTYSTTVVSNVTLQQISTNNYVSNYFQTNFFTSVTQVFTNNTAAISWAPCQTNWFDNQNRIVVSNQCSGEWGWFDTNYNQFFPVRTAWVSNLVALASVTNGSFHAIGVVTNDAGGKEYTSPGLPNTLLFNSSVTVAGTANRVTVSGSPVSLGGTLTLNGPQDIGVGNSPTFNAYNMTNNLFANMVAPTNGVTSAATVDFSIPIATTNVTSGGVSFTAFASINWTNYNQAIRWVVNRSGSDVTVTTGAWETDSGRTTATTYTCTNNTSLGLLFSLQLGQFTNVASIHTFK